MNKTKTLAFTGILAAIICVCGPWSLPTGPIPISLATFAVYLAASVINWKIGTVSVIVYIILGAVGLPVFSNFSGGFGKLMGVTGGYIFGYIICAIIVGLFVDKVKLPLAVTAPLGMVIGTAALYTLGTIWFMVMTGNGLAEALLLCVVPFLIGDAIKIVAVTVIVVFVRPAVKKLVI